MDFVPWLSICKDAELFQIAVHYIYDSYEALYLACTHLLYGTCLRQLPLYAIKCKRETFYAAH